MDEHANAARMRTGYEAFGKGELEVLRELWSPDIRWHEPGRHQLSGEYTGPDQVFGLFARTMELTEGSFRVELRKVFADDTDGVALVRITAHRGDAALDVVGAHLFRFEGDRVAEFWEAPTDQHAADEFFA